MNVIKFTDEELTRARDTIATMWSDLSDGSKDALAARYGDLQKFLDAAEPATEPARANVPTKPIDPT